mgnify:CR=1 FL=1
MFVIIIYMFILLFLGKFIFRWSANNFFRSVESYSSLPIDGGKGIANIFMILFFIHEVFVLIAFRWFFYFMLLLPWVMVLIIAPFAQKHAIKLYIKENEECGISKEDSIKVISSHIELQKNIGKIKKI